MLDANCMSFCYYSVHCMWPMTFAQYFTVYISLMAFAQLGSPSRPRHSLFEPRGCQIFSLGHGETDCRYTNCYSYVSVAAKYPVLHRPRDDVIAKISFPFVFVKTQFTEVAEIFGRRVDEYHGFGEFTIRKNSSVTLFYRSV